MLALEAVMKDGLSEEARELAAAALSALSEKELVATKGQKHVMLSCEFCQLCQLETVLVFDCRLSCGRESVG